MILRRVLPFVLAACLLASAGGCLGFRREPPRPGRTVLKSPLVTLPATTVSNYLIIEAKWDKRGPYHFLVDTGASVTLVTAELAARYPAKNMPLPPTPLVRVKSAEGETALLSATTLRRIELGDARFDYVPALIYDCSAISAHLGIKIDGILGFPLFRETLLTLDYPHSQVLLRPRWSTEPLPGSVIAFNNDRKTPIIPVRLGGQTFIALIDSGSDAALSLNPVGLQPAFALAPRVGATVATLSGDREQRIGRLADNLRLGAYTLERPVAELTDDLSSMGGGLLKHFTVTFDQEHGRVTFHRVSPEPIPPEPRRSAGLSFDKTPAYWRVAGVVPDSPASAAGVQPGDLVTRIDGESIAQWDLRRYTQRVNTAEEIAFTFLTGASEKEKRLKVFDLVP
jgi:hypothetical protein